MLIKKVLMGNLKYLKIAAGRMNTTPAYHFPFREQVVAFQRIKIQSRSSPSYLPAAFYYTIKSDLFSFGYRVYSHISISHL